MNSLGTEEQQYTKQWYTCLGAEGKLLYKDFNNCAPHALTILGFHCHAIKNKIANHSIQKVPNLGNKRR